ncbi:MAG: 4Fe-4S binding protein [Bacteroidota bacterium]|nr:4Fe-4S binding protein [Bacteroidota bacterium]
MMELMMDDSMLVLDQFLPGAGWVQIILLAIYGAFLVNKMQDASESAIWRKRSWLLFSIVFFSQFALGILADDRFMMTGKLHLPVPFMILSGPVFRMQLTIMPILLFSSILLSGPAWCSHYCYFGAWDGVAATPRLKAFGLWRKDKSKGKVIGDKGVLSVKEMRKPIRNKWVWKWSFLVLVILAAWLFRMLNFSKLEALIPALALAGIGIGIMVFISRKRNKMVHCTTFCPVGTLVNFGKFISPFRMKIASNCTNCMLCIPSCPYDALNVEDIKAGKPGLTCTLCGDCVTSCEVGAIQYRFFKLSPTAARNLYLFITISLHVLCMGLARI